MKNEPFVIERTFDAPVEKVWQAITDKDVMKKWYFDVPDFKPEVGCEFTFIGGDDKQQFVHLCEVTEVIPQQKLTHSWRYQGYEGNSFVTWELFNEDGQTRVKLTHEGLETFPPISSFAKQNFVRGWTHIVGTSLPEFLAK